MSATTSHDPILIAGGGIGGLAAAVALAQRGLPVRVLERSETFCTAGAGIQLGPNATRLLARWGVLRRIEPRATRPPAVRLLDGASGRLLATTALGAAAQARHGAPYLALHRSDLHNGLLWTARAQAHVELTPGFAVERVTPTPAGVAAHATDGRTARGCALVASDGLYSALRAQLHPRSTLAFSGKTAWRALIPRREAADVLAGDDVCLWMAPRAHLVHYPVRGGEAVNIVAVVTERWRAQGWDNAGERALLLPHFDDWPAPVREALASPPRWRKWSLYRLPSLRSWTDGPVALLGDAAHPVLPFLAQGAALAIEDAAALAAAMASGAPAEDCLRRYEAARRGRAVTVQRAAERMGRVYHLDGLPRRARNLALRVRSPESLLKRFDWLYGHRVGEG